MSGEYPDKKGLMDLMEEVPASSITPDKPKEIEKPTPPDVNSILKNNWANKSNSLMADYAFGESFAKFGESKLTPEAFFARLSDAIRNILANEHQKRNVGSEDLKIYCDNLETSFKILAKEIERKGLPNLDTLAIISALQGFLANYVKTKKTTER